jgi:phasin family protein
MKLNETFELLTKSTDEGYANLRKLAEINMNTWEQLVAKQMAVMNLCYENTSKQAELLKEAKRADELVGQQTELARDLSEKLVESNKEVVEILNKTRDEYQGLAESSVEQAKTRLSEAAEVAKHAQAA